MELSTPLRKVATKLMAKFGGEVTLQSVTPGVYNPDTGTISEVVSETSLRGVLQDVAAREVNELVQAGDKRLIIAAADPLASPTTADRIVISGVSHEVIRIDTIEQDNTPITYELILRA